MDETIKKAVESVKKAFEGYSFEDQAYMFEKVACMLLDEMHWCLEIEHFITDKEE